MHRSKQAGWREEHSGNNEMSAMAIHPLSLDVAKKGLCRIISCDVWLCVCLDEEKQWTSAVHQSPPPSSFCGA